MTYLEAAVALTTIAVLCAWAIWIARTEAKLAARQRPERAEDFDIANTPMRFRGERVVGPESRSRVGS